MFEECFGCCVGSTCGLSSDSSSWSDCNHTERREKKIGNITQIITDVVKKKHSHYVLNSYYTSHTKWRRKMSSGELLQIC